MKYNSPANRIHGALIYARFSTEHQSDRSIEEQVADCRAWCEEHGIPVLGVYADYAVSGMKASRPQFDALIQSLIEGTGDSLVCYDQSRLSRDFLNWFALRQDLQKLGARVVSITQEYVGGDIQDTTVLIQETMLALHNQLHIADTKKKVKAALRYRASIGQHTGGIPPLGYALHDKQLSIDDQEAEVVRRIFREYDEGRSYRQIIDGLNADGIRTKRGSMFGSNSLHDLMHNERYVGVFRYGAKPYASNGRRNTHGDDAADALVIERPELAIVDRSLFDRVQAKMMTNKQKQGGRPPMRDYPLKGKVFCGKCGSALTASRSSARGYEYFYYRCAAKDRLHQCDAKPIKVDVLEDIVLTYVKSILGNADIHAKVADLVRKEADRITGSSLDRFKKKVEEKQSIHQQIERITDAIAMAPSSDALIRRLCSLEQKEKELDAQLLEMRNAAEIATQPARHLEEMVAEIMKDTSRAAMLSVVTRVDVFDDHIEIFTSFDPNPDPRERPDFSDTELLETLGDPSGVPIVSINTFGILISIRR